MTVTFFMKGSENKRKAKLQAIVYGLSIIVIYTVVGTIVAVTLGANFANFLSTHWLPNIFFFLIFIVFAASFLGMFEIMLPSWLVNKADKQADKGGYTGAFFMAFTLVLVSFSCTGPIVGAILVQSAGDPETHHRDAWLLPGLRTALRPLRLLPLLAFGAAQIGRLAQFGQSGPRLP
jgi:thiol:disulfide interchange protein